MPFIIIGLLLTIGILLLKSRRRPKEQPGYSPNNSVVDTSEEINSIDSLDFIKTAYQPKWMFSQNEKQIYYKLKEIAQQQKLILFAKVRLFDLVAPIKGHPKYKTNLYKIQAKHVDFVLTKENLVAKYIIELDDSSHNRPDRKKRDKFVDAVLTSCGYKILHITEIDTDTILKFLSEK